MMTPEAKKKLHETLTSVLHELPRSHVHNIAEKVYAELGKAYAVNQARTVELALMLVTVFKSGCAPCDRVKELVLKELRDCVHATHNDLLDRLERLFEGATNADLIEAFDPNNLGNHPERAMGRIDALLKLDGCPAHHDLQKLKPSAA